MINHFPTLLLNINTFKTSPSVANYFLGDESKEPGKEFREILATEDNELFVLEDIKTFIKITKMYNVLINKDYVDLTLPKELNNFYNLIFPEFSSKYVKQFLLYSYLRLIASTDKKDEIKKYDSRISYDLDEITSYFRLNKLSSSLTNNQEFKIIPVGKFIVDEKIEAPIQNFLIRQKENTNYVYIFSLADGKYYKHGKPPSGLYADMEVGIQPSDSSNKISKNILVGDTGLSFTISSKEGLNNFTASANKLWLFSVESPLRFDFTNKIERINNAKYLVDDMLNFNRDLCSKDYESGWNTHFNDVYRLVNLLLAYVERVNLVWQAKVM
jgi:hypothetical protein